MNPRQKIPATAARLFPGRGRKPGPWLAMAMALLGWLMLGAARLEAATTAESRVFSKALEFFRIDSWQTAEDELAKFIQSYPESTNRPQAVLFQAEARYKLTNYTGAIELLRANVGRAGPNTAEYYFWLGESHLKKQEYALAADAYARAVGEPGAFAHRLEASYGEAVCRLYLNDRDRVRALLADSNGVFQTEARRHPDNDYVIRGQLALAETLFHLGDLPAAETALNQLAGREVGMELEWRRQLLACRIKLATQRFASALQDATNLLTLAMAADQEPLVAESVKIESEILERLDRRGEAVAVYTNNFSRLIGDHQRQGKLKIIDLTDDTGQLKTILDKYQGDEFTDFALVKLGDLILRDYLALATNQIAPRNSATNDPAADLLKDLQTYVSRVPSPSPLWPKAQLQRGWYLWFQGNIAEGESAFRTAAGRLPAGEDQAVARFKAGDCEFRLGDFTNAIISYRIVTTNYPAWPAVQSNLVAQAWYQILRAAVELNDLPGAEEALRMISEKFPTGAFSEKGLLTAGQMWLRVDQVAKARECLTRFIDHFSTNSALAPEVELAIARTYVQEGNWPVAISLYRRWAQAHGTGRPEVEFDRAWVFYQGGQDTNAFEVFTNLVTQFPNDPLAQRARMWMGGYYFNARNLPMAEEQYNLLAESTHWPPPNRLTCEAQILAGRVARERQNWKDAAGHLTGLIDTLNKSPATAPPDILDKAYFAYGDVMIERPDGTNKYNEAILAFTQVSHQLAPAAWGRLGDCYSKLLDAPASFSNAVLYYQRAVDSDAAAAVRNAAEVGLAAVLDAEARLRPAERAALLRDAFRHYHLVAMGEAGGDPFWQKKAGVEAVRLLEENSELGDAMKLLLRLKAILPSAASAWDQKIQSLQEKQSAKNPGAGSP